MMVPLPRPGSLLTVIESSGEKSKDQLMFLLNIFGLYEQREDLDLEQDLFNMV